MEISEFLRTSVSAKVSPFCSLTHHQQFLSKHHQIPHLNILQTVGIASVVDSQLVALSGLSVRVFICCYKGFSNAMLTLREMHTVSEVCHKTTLLL